MSHDVNMLRGQMVRDLDALSAVVGDNCLSALVFDVPHDSAMQKLAIARFQIAVVAEHPASATEAAHDERLDVGLALIREVLGEL